MSSENDDPTDVPDPIHLRPEPIRHAEPARIALATESDTGEAPQPHPDIARLRLASVAVPPKERCSVQAEFDGDGEPDNHQSFRFQERKMSGTGSGSNQDPSSGRRPWGVVLGVMAALGIVVAVGYVKTPKSQDPDERTQDVAEAVDEGSRAGEDPTKDPGDVPRPEPEPQPAAAEPEPVVEAAPAVAEPEPEPAAVIQASEPASEPPSVPAPSVMPPAPEPAVPASLTVSSMGPNPRCVADCTWGDLADNGFPRTAPDGTRDVSCSDGHAWRVAKWTKLTAGAQANCYAVTDISAANASGE